MEAASEADHCGSCADSAIIFAYVVSDVNVLGYRADSAVALTESQPHFRAIPICTPPFASPLLINPTLRFPRSTTLLI